MNIPLNTRTGAPQMHEIYALTASGRHQLHGSSTPLPAVELEILVRVDGGLSLAKIHAGMPAISGETFIAITRRLWEQGLVTVVQVDPLALQMQASLDQLNFPGSQAKADTGASSLKTSGFFVEIARERLPTHARNPGEALTAVVVEDEPVLAKFIQSYLSFEGFQVRLASNRSEIVAAFRSPPIPDLILLDVLLPDADGFDVLLRLRQNKALNNVPIIMLTGRATREAVLKGMAGGADGYVTKPFEADALMRAVRTVVGLPEVTSPASDLDDDPWVHRDSRFWKS